MALGKQPARDTVNMILFSRITYAVNSNHEDLVSIRNAAYDLKYNGTF